MAPHAPERSPLVTIKQANLISPETLPIHKSARIKASTPELRSVGLRLRGTPAHFPWPCAMECPAADDVGGGATQPQPSPDAAPPPTAPAPAFAAASSVAPALATAAELQPVSGALTEEPTEDSAALQFFDHLGIYRGPHDHVPPGPGAAPAGSATALLYCHESLAEQSAPGEDEAKCWVDSHLDQWQTSTQRRSEVAALCEAWLSASPAA
tara:strand:- start:75 stop:707 length:633 start_codon:yes stop_codon:yes gene_type:complete